MGFLLSSDWVIGEAANLNIAISPAAVRTQFDHIRATQFPKRGEFTAFLHRSGQTVADLLFRVRRNMLSQAIQQKVVAGQPGSSTAGALEQFDRAFHDRWTAQTTCATAYAVADCGHVIPAI